MAERETETLADAPHAFVREYRLTIDRKSHTFATRTVVIG